MCALPTLTPGILSLFINIHYASVSFLTFSRNARWNWLVEKTICILIEFPTLNMAYVEASAVARKRRAASIAAFTTTPSWPEAELPANLTEFALKSGYYTPNELEIVESEADAILDKIKTRAWTSLDVAKAFCKASALAQELVSLIAIVLGRLEYVG